ncbi:MAG: DUF177 domain-containing protein [candidate division Zixibacteria bacterium]|nr:DUF177 domain-containing protein [candidate division Zixibacteria bacterium]
MKIELKGITESFWEVHLSASRSEISFKIEGVTFTDGISADLNMSRADEMYIISGSCGVNAKMDCVRCLEPAKVTLSGNISVLAGQRGAGGMSQLEGEEDLIIIGDNEVLEMDDPIRQALISSIPMKPLCDESCLGLCQHCGVNRNQFHCDCESRRDDPRWEALNDLKSRVAGADEVSG